MAEAGGAVTNRQALAIHATCLRRVTSVISSRPSVSPPRWPRLSVAVTPFTRHGLTTAACALGVTLLTTDPRAQIATPRSRSSR